MSVFLRLYKHLLPRARAWYITVTKPLRNFFVALSDEPSSVRTFFDDVWDLINPQTTTEITVWEKQWGLTESDILEQERRDRLDAAWKARGGQNPRYIQDKVWNAGFTDVYLHQWWEPGSDPPISRVPVPYVTDTELVLCGEALAECGEATAECGEFEAPAGYLLVNKIFVAQLAYTALCGEALAACGESLAECGENDGIEFVRKGYDVTTDPATWPLYMYFCGETFGTQADVPLARKDEFENLLLTIDPAQQWLVLIINYT